MLVFLRGDSILEFNGLYLVYVGRGCRNLLILAAPCTRTASTGKSFPKPVRETANVRLHVSSPSSSNMPARQRLSALVYSAFWGST